MSDRDFAQAAPATDFEEDQPIGGTWHGEPVVLVRHQGRVCAFAGECTHQGAALADGIVVDGELRCPWHHARFALSDGEAIAAPAFAPLDRFVVEESAGAVRVTEKLPAPEPTVPARTIGRVVIVGAGAAGYACAEMLARHGAGASVIVISDDPDPPYDRTTCSKSYLAGEDARADVMMPAPGGDEGVAPAVRTATRIVALDPAGKTVTTQTGERIAYDVLVLATGAEPVAPDFPGHDRNNVYPLRTLGDADRLITAAGNARAAVVLGSSYIGLEAAAALIARKLAVTIVSKDDIPLAQTAGPEVGEMLRGLHESKGVTFKLGRQIAAWDGHIATLDDGTTLSGDLLVVGVGVAPRLDLAKAAGAKIAGEDAGGGVLVNHELETSVPSVYAIGDVASVLDPRLGHPIRVEHWVVAQRQGQWLARHLLGLASGGYDDLPFFWSNHYDTSVTYIGHAGSTETRAIEGDVEAQDAAVFFPEHGRTEALLTLSRDKQSLQVEADWEAATNR